MYVSVNFKTKKALKEAVANGAKIHVYQPGPFGGGNTEGTCSVEGPHYPAAHSWYARVVVKDSYIVKVS